MKITPQCVVALTWTLKDTMEQTLDVLNEPVEFFVGGNDLLAVIEHALQSLEAGAKIALHIEPEEGFGEFDENLIFLQPRKNLPINIEVGMLIEPGVLTADSAICIPTEKLLTISEIYPEHVVLDANHPLAGIALRLYAKVEWVRQAEAQEIAQGTLGIGFFKIEPSITTSLVNKSPKPGSLLH